MEETKKKSGYIVGIVCMIVLTIANIALFIVNIYINNKEIDEKEDVEAVATIPEEKKYTANEMADLLKELEDKSYASGYEDLKTMLKDSILEGNSVNAAIRDIFTEYVIYIYDNEYIFEPINAEYGLNELNHDRFIISDKDLSTYTIDYKDDNIDAMKGIDVSKFQGEIDWQKVAADDVEFAFVRVGYRGYETGKLVEDEMAKTNIENALKNNIKTGVYFYTQAITEEEAIEEANFVIDIIKDYDVNYPVAFDLEIVGDELARTNSLTPEERIKIVNAFFDTITEAGYKPMLYGNLATMFSMVEYDGVKEYEKWFAYYDTELYFPYDLAIWQYSCTGKIDGIEGDCDLNLAFKDLLTE